MAPANPRPRDATAGRAPPAVPSPTTISFPRGRGPLTRVQDRTPTTVAAGVRWGRSVKTLAVAVAFNEVATGVRGEP